MQYGHRTTSQLLLTRGLIKLKGLTGMFILTNIKVLLIVTVKVGTLFALLIVNR